MLDRVWHLKTLSSIVVLAFGKQILDMARLIDGIDEIVKVSKRIAILAMVPFLYSVFVNEIGYLIKGKSGVNVEKTRRPRPQKQPERNYRLPDMGVAYLYQPGELRWLPGCLAKLTRRPNFFCSWDWSRSIADSSIGRCSASAADDRERAASRRWP